MASKTPRPEDHEPRESVIGWLLDSDPSIRWQVMRDLMGEPDDVVAEERSRVADRGLGCAAPRPPGGRTASGVMAPPPRSGRPPCAP